MEETNGLVRVVVCLPADVVGEVDCRAAASGLGGKVLCSVEEFIERRGWASGRRLDAIESEYVEWEASGEEKEAWHTARRRRQGFARCEVVDLRAYGKLVEWLTQEEG